MNKKLITIKIFSRSSEAHVDKSYLAHHGIWSFLKNDRLIDNDWFSSLAIGGVRLQVKESDVTNALSLLGQSYEN